MTTINSLNGVRDAKPAVIVTDGKLVTTAAALNDKSAKYYHHVIPGARTIMPNGTEIVFKGGLFVTADKEVQAFLDELTKHPAITKIYMGDAKSAANAPEKQIAQEAGNTI